MLVSLFFAIVFHTLSSAAADCVTKPLVLSIRNTTLSNGAIRRGIALKVGNPPEEFSFLPKWDNNNTFLYGPKCDSRDLTKTEQACITFRGGLYDAKSKTKGAAPSGVEIPQEDWNPDTYSIFSDTLDFGGNNSFTSFPFAEPLNVTSWDLQGYDPQHILGLGDQSTLMTTLRKNGHIASNSVGFYWGLDGTYDSDQSEGSIVFGGYDRAKTYGNGHTRPLEESIGCPTGIRVNIADIVLNFSNGTDASIFPPRLNGGDMFEACVIPAQPSVMDLPYYNYSQILYKAIENGEHGRSGGVDFWNLILSPKLPIYTGDLTFVLDSNVKIKVPNHQLVVPERYIDDDGKIVTNSSNSVLRINSLQDTTKLVKPGLGRYFLSSAYVLVNRDAGEYTLWPANPTSDQNLIPVDEKNKELSVSQDCSDGSNGPKQGGDSGSKPSSKHRSSLSSGAIAGIAVGAVVAIGGALGLWWFMAKKKKSHKSAEVPSASNNFDEKYQSPNPHQALPHGEQNPWPAQGYPHYIPQEMASQSTRTRPVELAADHEN